MAIAWSCALVFCNGALSSTIVTGPGPGTSTMTMHAFDVFGGFIGGDWFIDDGAGLPQVVSASPDAGPWVKQLSPPPPTTATAFQHFLIEENIEIGSGPAWTDWHAEIMSSRWRWIPEGSVIFLGLDIIALGQGDTFDLLNLWFEYDPLGRY